MLENMSSYTSIRRKLRRQETPSYVPQEREAEDLQLYKRN